METIIFVGLVLSGMLALLILASPQNTKQEEQDKQLFGPATRFRPFYNMKMELKMSDNGGTRTGIDRRKFKYTAYIPENRSGMDRRKGVDRRSGIARRIGAKRKNSLNHPGPYPKERRDIFKTIS